MTIKKSYEYKSRDKSPPSFNNKIKLSKKSVLLKRILSAEFAMWEIALYLETNPYDKKAFETYEKYKHKSERLKSEYKNKYKP